MRASLSVLALLPLVISLAACSDRGEMPDPEDLTRPDGGAGDAGMPGHCDNGARDADETHLDCGGSCLPCPSGSGCSVAADCESGVCTGGFCLVGACDDGIQNGSETDLDCGGDCDPCEGGAACGEDTDCTSGVCTDRACQDSSCGDGALNSTETDVDCGGPACGPCRAMEACLEDRDCQSRVCVGELCSPSMCTDGVQNGAETDSDCGGGSCPGCGDGAACVEDGDCSRGECRESVCISCGDGILNGDETDVDCGGPGCIGCADGKSCSVPTDCMGGDCRDGACISCTDGVMNGDESDVDCGGPLCGGCADGEACSTADDCTSLVCTDGTCAVPSCADGVQNADETDVDCGGSSCTPCAVGDTCATATDCGSGVCSGTCQAPTCSDGVSNGDETDVDCGGSSCALCADFRRCAGPSDCTAGVCTMGRCGTFTGCHWGLVSDGSKLDNVDIHDLLLSNGHTFTVHNDNSTMMHVANSSLLSGYDFLLFNNHNRAISTAERDTLQAWLDGGGSLVVTGYDSLATPSDPNLAALVGCTSPGSGPYSSTISVVNASHAIMSGPFRTFASGTTLTADNSNHDRCTPAAGATRLLEVSGASKLQIMEGIGAGNGRVVYWNGNSSFTGSLGEWDGSGGSQPELQDLLLNVITYLCGG